jgi:hypothetical protein
MSFYRQIFYDVAVTAPTVINDQSIEEQLTLYRDALFPCSATTDRSTQLTRRWLFNDEPIYEDDYIFVADNGSLVILMSQETDGGASRAGMYRCHVTNGYSSSDIYVKLFTITAEC